MQTSLSLAFLLTVASERSSSAEKKLAERKKLSLNSMSDPRNVAHAKKVTLEKKHHGTEARPEDALAAQPGKKPRAR